MKRTILLLVGAVTVTSLVGCSINPWGSTADSIIIGGKNFTEQDIMVDMMMLLIEHDTKLHVKTKTWLDSNVVWNAMQNGRLDMYVEYTGTGLINILQQNPQPDPQKVS